MVLFAFSTLLFIFMYAIKNSFVLDRGFAKVLMGIYGVMMIGTTIIAVKQAFVI